MTQFSEQDKRPAFIDKAERLAAAVGQTHSVEVKVVSVNATPKDSASKVRPERP